MVSQEDLRNSPLKLQVSKLQEYFHPMIQTIKHPFLHSTPTSFPPKEIHRKIGLFSLRKHFSFSFVNNNSLTEMSHYIIFILFPIFKYLQKKTK